MVGRCQFSFNDPFLQCGPCVLGELELDRPSGLSLDDRRPIAQDARYRQIAHFDRRQIASAKLTVDRKVEESKLSEIRGNL